MATFARFEIVRQCFDIAIGWKTYRCFMDSAQPITLDRANEIQRTMDWKHSTTLAVIPIA